jgi:hypothetical protein
VRVRVRVKKREQAWRAACDRIERKERERERGARGGSER